MTEPQHPQPPQATPAAPRGPLVRLATAGWPAVLVAGVFALLYAYEVWQGISLVGTPTQQIYYLKLMSLWLGILVLSLGIVVPVIVYVLSLWFARRQPTWVLALVLLTGLVLTPALTLSIATAAYRIALSFA